MLLRLLPRHQDQQQVHLPAPPTSRFVTPSMVTNVKLNDLPPASTVRMAELTPEQQARRRERDRERKRWPRCLGVVEKKRGVIYYFLIRPLPLPSQGLLSTFTSRSGLP